MTTKFGFSEILFTSGALLVVAAIAAGLVLGGKGSARAERSNDLRLERLQAVADAAQCVFAVSGKPPVSIHEVERAARATVNELDRNCYYIESRIARDFSDVRYSLTDADSASACVDYAPTREPTRKPRCLPVEFATVGLNANLGWPNIIDVETLPSDLQADAEADERMIGDAVNLLRMADCLYRIDGKAPSSLNDALETLSHSPESVVPDCEWISPYFAAPHNKPVATYALVDDDTVAVCADYRRAWSTPLRLSYYGDIPLDWPVNQPALQAPVEPGRTCYEIDLQRTQ